MIKKIIYSTILFLLLSPIATHAIFINLDWQVTNDKAITKDTETGLEWLDINLTANISYNDMVQKLQQEVKYKGFRHAKMKEIETFWNNAGIFDFSNTYLPQNYQPVKDLISYIGGTTITEVYSIGIYGEKTQSDYQRTASIQYWEANEWGKANLTFNAVLPGSASASRGNYLVRNSATVPEPSSIILTLFWIFTYATRKKLKKKLCYQ